MRNKTIAIFCMALIICLPLSYAQPTPPDPTVGARVPGGLTGLGDDIAEDILIEVETYEPTVLISSLLEENDVPVYANLIGSRTNPFIEVPRIRNIAIRPTSLDSDIVKGVTWVRPGGRVLLEGKFERPTTTYTTLDDLGYLIILLKRIEKEKEVPEIIDIDLEATISYDLGSGTGLNEQDLVLSELSEEEWLDNQAEQNKGSFLGQSRSAINGYVRVNDVKSDGASLAIYRSNLQKIANMNLEVGEISGVHKLYEFGSYEDAFRIRLNDVKEPQDKAKINVNIDGNVDKKLLSKGQSIYPGSLWKVKDFFKEGNEEILNIVHEKTREIKRFSRTAILLEGEEVKSDPFEKARNFRVNNNYDSAIAEYERIIRGVNNEIKDDARIRLNRVKALVEFEKVLNNFADVSFPNGTGAEFVDSELRGRKAGAEALIQIARVYEEFGTASDIENSINAYERLSSEYSEEERSFSNLNIDGRLRDLIAKRGSNYEGEAFFEDNKRISLTVLGFELLKDVGKTYVEFNLGDDRNRARVSLGRNIFDKEKYNVEHPYTWILEVTDTESVLLTRPCKDDKESGCKNGVISKTLRLNKADNLRVNEKESQRVELTLTRINKEAYITVLPGVAYGISKTNFSLHIPVEKRAIKFSDDKVGDLINKTQKQIERLNDIIEDLSNIVEVWKQVCLVTFAYVTIKNFLTGLSGKEIARTQAMDEHWRPFCQDEVAKGAYDNLDDCYSSNSKKITSDISAYQSSVSKVDDLEINEENKFSNLKDIEDLEYGAIEEYETKTGKKLISQENVRDLNLYDELLDKEKLSSEHREDIEIKRKGLLDEINRDNEIAEGTMGSYNSWLESISKEESQRSLQWKNFREEYGDASFERTKTLVLENLWYQNNKEFQEQFKPTFDNSNVQNFFYSETEINKFNEGKEIVRLSSVPVTSNNVKFIMVGDPPEPTPLTPLKEKEAGGEDEDLIKDTQGRQIYTYVEEGKTKYIITDSEIDAAGLRDNYVVAEVQYNDKCKAADMVPIGDGNYVNVEYDQFCRPITRSLWNGGLDGLFPTQDDILLVAKADWDNPPAEYRRDVSYAKTLISNVNNQIQKVGVGGTVKIGNIPYTVGLSRTQGATQTQCQDFMDVNDCDLLFLACDAVLCPPSRCNLDGNWHVPNVIQSGIIGSVVLCFPTTDTKICLSGILASLQNIRSVLEGFNQCLKTQKISGKSVGICDKIRSVYICELVWREVINLLNAREGVISLLGDTLFGASEGGGEYLDFDASFQNVEDTLSFFVNDYGKGSFRDFEGKSLGEVGTEVCKAAIFVEYPGPGILERVTKPESPPQFTAEFDAYPYSERTQQSRYSVFYHIYAGENPGLSNENFVRYNVFLKSNTDPRLGFFGVTERCRGNLGLINVGEFASFNIDCVADSGYDQVCVSIDGRTSCGFGTVTTDFGLNYMNDLIIDGQVRKEIKTEKECVGTFSTSSGVGDATFEGIGFLRTGLVRKCSIEKPSEDWEFVGSCGEDNFGRVLGSCWLDTRSIEIKNEATRQELIGVPEENIPGFLSRKTEDFLIKEEGKLSNEEIIKLFGEGGDNIRGADYYISEAEKSLEKDEVDNAIKNYKEAINSYEFIVDSSVDTELIAYAQYRLGIIYLKMVRLWQKEKKPAVGEDEKTSGEESEDSLQKLLTGIKKGRLILITTTDDRKLLFEKEQDEYWTLRGERFGGDDKFDRSLVAQTIPTTGLIESTKNFEFIEDAEFKE